ncbi:MAG TPA: hypothetical protein VFT22_06195 [Kofleriaceae bacterium]|nr:hypothetical protein [Kofleriaceae bacterium]
MKRLIQISIASLLLTACGGDDPSFGPPAAPTEAEQMAIQATEAGLIDISAVDVNGPDAGIAAIGLATTATLIFDPASGASSGPGLLTRGDPRMPSAMAMLQRALLADCPAMNANSIVWDQCTQDGLTIDGSISWSTGHVDVDLHIFGSASGFTIEYTMNTSMTVTASAIQGDMTIKVSASGGGMQASETVHSEIDVQVADACITGGTLTMIASGSGTGAVNGAVQIVWSGCHVAQIRKG